MCSMEKRSKRPSIGFLGQRLVSACEQIGEDYSRMTIQEKPLATGTAARIGAKLVAFLCAVAVVSLARPATAAELAILRNGFSIRHEHRLVMGATTRLFLSADDSSFTDVPTEEIAGYEKDLLAPLTADLSESTPPQAANSGKFLPVPALDDVVKSDSANDHLDPDLVNSV